MATQVIQPKDTSSWSVYTLADSRCPEIVRYVGITNNPASRLRGHKADKSSSHKACWVRSVIRAAATVKMTIIASGLCWEGATRREVEEISRHRDLGFRLTNATDGGDGIPGYIASEELRAVRRINAKGRKHSPETRAKMSAWQTGLKRPERGSAIAEAKRMSPPKNGRFKGVYARGNSWTANIYIDGKQKYLGAFHSMEDAAKAYDMAAVKEWGSRVWLNFPANENLKSKNAATTL